MKLDWRREAGLKIVEKCRRESGGEMIAINLIFITWNFKIFVSTAAAMRRDKKKNFTDRSRREWIDAVDLKNSSPHKRKNLFLCFSWSQRKSLCFFFPALDVSRTQTATEPVNIRRTFQYLLCRGVDRTCFERFSRAMKKVQKIYQRILVWRLT